LSTTLLLVSRVLKSVVCQKKLAPLFLLCALKTKPD